MSAPTFVMAWQCDGETVVLPFIDPETDELTDLVREMVDRFDLRGIDPAAAIWRGIAGERAERIVRLREAAREAGELAEWYRERFGSLEDWKT